MGMRESLSNMVNLDLFLVHDGKNAIVRRIELDTVDLTVDELDRALLTFEDTSVLDIDQ